jgi:putative chitinase
MSAMPAQQTTRLTPHFLLEEFTLSSSALALGIENTPTPAHLENLKKLAACMEEVRTLFNAVIEITSGYRNPQVNAAVGGVPTSAHALGLAADFHVHGMKDLDAAKRIRDSDLTFDQLIFEKNRCVHLSIDPRMRRQVLRQPGGPGSKVFEGLA